MKSTAGSAGEQGRPIDFFRIGGHPAGSIADDFTLPGVVVLATPFGGLFHVPARGGRAVAVANLQLIYAAQAAAARAAREPLPPSFLTDADVSEGERFVLAGWGDGTASMPHRSAVLTAWGRMDSIIKGPRAVPNASIVRAYARGEFVPLEGPMLLEVKGGAR